MNLTTTEKYALAVLEAKGKLDALQKQERGVCLVASCLWDMMEAEVLAPDSKGKLKVSAQLPELLAYCSPIYELLAKRHRKPEDVVMEYTASLTDKRIKALVKSIADGLVGKSVLVVEERSGLLSVKLCHVDHTVLTEDMVAVKSMDGTVSPEQFMFAILLLKSGVANRLLNKEEMSSLKKAVKQDRSDFHPYVNNLIRIVETTIASVAVASVMLTQ